MTIRIPYHMLLEDPDCPEPMRNYMLECTPCETCGWPCRTWTIDEARALSAPETPPKMLMVGLIDQTLNVSDEGKWSITCDLHTPERCARIASRGCGCERPEES